MNNDGQKKQRWKIVCRESFLSHCVFSLCTRAFQATLSLNIPDFTRHAKSQKAQALGQALGLPLTSVLFSALGKVCVWSVFDFVRLKAATHFSAVQHSSYGVWALSMMTYSVSCL
jgi:NCS1 family nucleobase:cation symporter-1